MGQQHSSVFRIKKPNPRSLRPNPSSSTSSQPVVYDAFRWVDMPRNNENPNPIYAIPVDETEYTRLNAQHFQIRYVFQGDYQAPLAEELTRGIKVLDTGCGTGVWSIEMAKKFPASSFTGSDTVDRFKGMETPDNVTFTVADTLALPFEEGTFDFVFQRLQSLSFLESKWPKAIEELLRVTKPGGTIELS
ncbi:S-adenosyl-L-methionine-dependent methyltransferase [Endogone sp. FLAS-F59071]|nr:S-adenosyl-L-methionine-dependent methyltransferase [Endogone sp. FLAS-F59071]|eukprot:RUS22159.1 S-adenosyl-L-methionine-dependent methyltransferase [Endogone sp. FLAS-F59071]